MKVKFIAPEKTKEFHDGQILEAAYPANGNRKMLVIKNAQNEHYGYPALWFEILQKD